MGIKEKNLPLTTTVTIESFVRTLGNNGESERTTFQHFKDAIAGDKVDKVPGKGLSANDFTNADKEKLNGIEVGAQVNPDIDSTLSDSSENAVQNKVITGALAEKADVDGNYPDLTSGSSLQLLADKGAEDSVPYNFRPSGGGVNVGDREIDAIVGGSLVWNQLVQNGNFADTSGWTAGILSSSTLSIANNKAALSITTANVSNSIIRSGFDIVSNHKYLIGFFITTPTNTTSTVARLYKGGTGYASTPTVSVVANNKTRFLGIASPSDSETNVTLGLYADRINGTALTGDVVYEDVQLFDLTQMFGTTIADYIYNLERNTAGAGVAFFKKLFPKPYYEYTPVGIESVKAGSHEMVGFNQWDEEWEVGSINPNTGQPTTADNRIRSKNFIPIIPSTAYYFRTTQAIAPIFYDGNKNYISNTTALNSTVTTPSNACFMKFRCSTDYGTTYNHDICINFHWDGERDGEYEPYVKHSYSLDDTLELRGIPKLDASNQLYYDGDTYESDGTVTRRYGIVDLGTLNYTVVPQTSEGGTVDTFGATIDAKPNGGTIANCVAPIYKTVDSSIASLLAENMVIAITSNGTGLRIRNDSYNSDTTAFKTAMSGVYLVYELATPTTEQATPYTNPQIVDDWGTEEYTDYAYEAGDRDVEIPVGHETFYPENLREKIEGLPWNLSMLATIENGTTASKAYSAGEYFLKDDMFCKALTSIASGATFTLNTNYTVTTVAAEIYAALNA